MLQLLLLLALCFLCCFVAIILFFIPRLRYLSAYLTLGSVGVIAGIATFVLLAAYATKGMDDSDAGLGSAVLVLLGFMTSALLGAGFGGWLAYRLNRRMGWIQPAWRDFARKASWSR